MDSRALAVLSVMFNAGWKEWEVQAHPSKRGHRDLSGSALGVCEKEMEEEEEEEEQEERRRRRGRKKTRKGGGLRRRG